ncbi:glycoside hydrolase [Tsuneonella suprasediminis]|uniref:glycoside hydrolase n=1 Tax=Tsuneonella suprasediminis TaxID=2306996 RepID=UPI001F0C353E|nr:glycoside hydrolase [Tsuneonella suprasediminis]
MRIAAFAGSACLLALGGCASVAPAAPAVPALSATYHTLDPFYSKRIEADGIPIVGSDRVSDEALAVAQRIVEQLLSYRPDLAQWLVANRYRVAIMAESETTTDLPEQAHWKKPSRNDPRLTRCERKLYSDRIGALTDRQYWDQRARGMAGVLTSGAEEDLLGKRSSRYWGETIFVHEFSHNILSAIRAVDPKLARQVDAAYAHALASGLWKDEYASTTVDEYWAEGSQFWFDSNRLAVFDGRRILNHADLAAYDPQLYAVLGQAYGNNHQLRGDPFWMSAARVPPGPIPENTAEVC